MSKPFRVAVAGLGTVGAGVVKILEDNKDVITKRAGRPSYVFYLSLFLQ